jgi:pantetheine-phosphate adenylyltransferase
MKNIALYPGSFDPFTMGHFDIAERASKIFDELWIGVLDNSRKKYFLPKNERVRLIKESVEKLENVKVVSFSGLLVDFMRENKLKIIVRGLRAVSDFEYEFQMALMNKRLNIDVETMFLVTSSKYSYLSSTIVKEIYFNGGDISGLVPVAVLEYLKNRNGN